MILKTFGIALTALTLAACASPPTQPAAATAATSTPALAPAKSGAEAAPVATSADGKPPVLSRALIQAGYKATTVKGEIYYCRQEDVIGTGFKKKVCLNEDQIKEEDRRIKELQDQMLRTQASPSCMGPTCSG
jgi:hypothetical protein